jgi:lysozyme family protein
MIPLFLDDGTRNPFTFGGLTFNSPTADPNDVFELNGVVPTAAFDAAIDSGPSHDGAILAPAKRVYYLLRIDGVIRAKTYSALYDKKRSLAAAVDPARASLANSSTVGVTALDFNVPTEDLTNFPSGLVASRYYARARTGATPPDSMYQGRNAPFSLDLIVPDPRRVAQSLTTKVNSGSATNLGDNPSPTTLSIAMAGAGSALFTIARAGTLTGTKTLALDLSGRVNLDVVTVDMLTGVDPRQRGDQHGPARRCRRLLGDRAGGRTP